MEMAIISLIAPDEDGSLKIKQHNVFFDSKAHIDFFKNVAEAKSEMEHSSSHVA